MRQAIALFLGLLLSLFFTPAGAEESAAPKTRSEAPAANSSRTKANKEPPPEEVIQNLELLQNLPLLKEIDLFKEMPARDKKSACAETSPGCSKQGPPSRTKGDGEASK
ncbi:MAG: hypothetical protein HY282_17210 [Nitrospirae bacterium]|nr:hypothetical protein [Candidatus Manganitrophaceae bacterium]